MLLGYQLHIIKSDDLRTSVSDFINSRAVIYLFILLCRAMLEFWITSPPKPTNLSKIPKIPYALDRSSVHG